MISEKKRKLNAQRAVLDRLLGELKTLEISRPQRGWLRTIRESLGMTVSQLARRASLDQTTVTRLESNEAQDALTLKSLKRLSAALDCELVYALVPRTSLKATLIERANLLLRHEEQRVEKTMSLENLGGGEVDNSIQKALLIGTLDKRLWDEV